jgi:glycosyltransferase involved in cell wall biosynthesis
MTKLSVCCMTSDPAPQVIAILRDLRDVADEIVVAVDSRREDAAAYLSVADTVVRYEYAPPVERAAAWLHAQCHGRWVLRLDGDEVPSQALVQALPELIAADDVLQYWIARRWLFPDGAHALDEQPWWPDFQLRLYRNDPATLWIPGLLHSSVAQVQPARYVDLPIYHLTCLLLSEDERIAKAADYERTRPDLYDPNGFSPNSYYAPERFDSPAVMTLPPGDRAHIAEVLEPPDVVTPDQAVPLVERVTIDDLWAARIENVGAPDDFYQAVVSVMESDVRMAAGVSRQLAVRVHNTSPYDWPGGIADRPGILIGSRWVVEGDETVVIAEGPRRHFPATVRSGATAVVPVEVVPPDKPGRYILRLDLLHDYNRWFDRGVDVPVTIRHGDTSPAVIALWVDAESERFFATVRTLVRGCPGLRIVAAGPGAEGLRVLDDVEFDHVTAESVPELVNTAFDQHDCHVVLVTDAVTVPPGLLARALGILEGDARVATVSFLSNDAGFLSFPHRDAQGSHQIRNLDEIGITRALRRDTSEESAAVIPWPTGALVLISGMALRAVGPLREAIAGDTESTVADFGLRARQRGFLDVLDPSTFVSRPFDLGVRGAAAPEAERRAWLTAQHPAYTGFLEHDTADPASALSLCLTSARCAVFGIDVLIDGSSLGVKEMGTQVQTVAVLRALAEHDGVASIAVLLSGDVPAYAAETMSHPKIRPVRGEVDLHGSSFDVLHRPFQPDVLSSMDPWRSYARRALLTVQDTIAYQIGSYHDTPEAWRRYRKTLRDAVATVDGVIVISHHVRRQLLLERLPVDADRIFVSANGTDHLRGDEPEHMPKELFDRGFLAEEFVLVIGANYMHKNRDLALAAFAELRRRGHKLTMVCVGALVPFGSSRVHEARSGDAYRDDVYVIPDVSSEERNWLLRHAAVVLYPTGAEGFGLVPHEAARFGTPVVFVPFGPLHETIGTVPVVAFDWAPRALADATEELLQDPALARKQVAATLDAATTYTWEKTAEALVHVYRDVIGRPSRSAPSSPEGMA